MDPKKLRKLLQNAVERKKQSKLDEAELGSITSDLSKSLSEKMDPSQITQAIAQAAAKSIEGLTVNQKQLTKEDIVEALSGLQIPEPRVEVNVPDFPEIKIPTPVVNVTPPEVNIPEINIPATVFPERMMVDMERDRKNPMPVILMDTQGKPFQFSFPQSGGGKTDFLTIKGFAQSAFSEISNPDGRVKVELPTGSSGLTDTELRASSVPVAQASGALWSVAVKEIFGSTITTLLNGDNRIPVSVETGGSGLTDSELRASSVPVAQVSGAVWSTLVTEIFGTTGTNLVNPDNRMKVELPDGASGLTDSELRASSVPVAQVSGAIWSTEVTNTVTVDATTSGDVPITLGGESVQVTGITNTIAANVVDSTGVAYSSSNPLPVDDAGGSITVDASALDIRALTNADVVTAELSATDNAVLDAIDAVLDTIKVDTEAIETAVEAIQTGQLADGHNVTIDNGTGVSAVNIQDGGNSITVDGTSLTNIQTAVQIMDDWDEVHDSAVGSDGALVMAEARTTNPTAVADGDATRMRADDLGRLITRPVQVRDLIATAYTSLTNGTETTLLAGAASTFHDLIYVMGANQSDAAVTVDLRCGTGGAVVMTLQIPASGTAGVSLSVPHKMPEVAQAWTADMDDVTGTTVDITAQFSKEI